MDGVRYELRSEGTILVLTTGARFTTDHLLDTMTRALRDPAAQLPIKLLVDNRGCTESASTEEVQRRAGMLGSRVCLFVPWVAVVVSDDLQYALARMNQAYLEEHGIAVAIFRDFDEALGWLAAR